MVISIDVEEAFDKIQHSYDKNSPENRDTENLLQNNKAKYEMYILKESHCSRNLLSYVSHTFSLLGK